MSELKHVKRLSSVRSNAGVKFLTPAAFPGNHCPMHTALAISSNINGMSTLVVGTAECGIYSRKVVEHASGKEGVYHWMYILDAREVVFGCREGLIGAIREMDQTGTKAIMLVLTCVPEVIGEDIEGIVREIQPEVKAQLSFVLMGHFKCNSYPSGYWKTLAAFGELVEQAETCPDIVNILGRSPREEHVPEPELLQALKERGFRLRMLAPKSDIADFIDAGDARLNLVLSPYMNPLAELMKRRCGVPYISLHETYDVPGIDRLYADVAEALDIQWHDEFEAARKEAASLHERARQVFQGISYIATHQNALTPLPLALYLAELHMKPLLLHVEEFYPDDRKWAKALKGVGEDPLICHMVNEEADAKVLERMNPALSFGEIPGGTGAIPCVSHLYELYGRIGYERTCLLINRMLETWQQTERLRIGRNMYGTV